MNLDDITEVKLEGQDRRERRRIKADEMGLHKEAATLTAIGRGQQRRKDA